MIAQGTLLKEIGRTYTMYFVNHDGLWPIITTASRLKIKQLHTKLDRIKEHLIIK